MVLPVGQPSQVIRLLPAPPGMVASSINVKSGEATVWPYLPVKIEAPKSTRPRLRLGRSRLAKSSVTAWGPKTTSYLPVSTLTPPTALTAAKAARRPMS